jgi:hypothetical protein
MYIYKWMCFMYLCIYIYIHLLYKKLFSRERVVYLINFTGKRFRLLQLVT